MQKNAKQAYAYKNLETNFVMKLISVYINL